MNASKLIAAAALAAGFLPVIASAQAGNSGPTSPAASSGRQQSYQQSAQPSSATSPQDNSRPKTRAEVVGQLKAMSPSEKDQWRKMYHGG